MARPVVRWSASRASSRVRRASARPSRGASATQDAATARRAVASRSPPRASLRSGSSRNWSSPMRSARSRQSSSRAGSRLGAWLRQSARTVVRSPATRPRSPATGRASSSPSWTLRSSPAVLRASPGVRTEWSRARPRSQTGYQMPSASAATAAASAVPSCRSSRSRSLRGESSPRPYPPTATRAAPRMPARSAAVVNSPSSHASVSRARAARRGGPDRASCWRRRSRAAA